MNGLDRSVFSWINGWPEAFSPFFVFLSEATKRPEGITLLVIVFIALMVKRESRKPALYSMLAWPLADGLTNLLKKGLQWPRPSFPEILAQNPSYHVRGEPLTSYGTASAHSANMMAVAVCFLCLYRPLGWVWLAVAFFTGISRIYVGVHWPSQVLFGWFCGAVVALVVVKALERVISARKSPEPEEQPAEP